MAIHTQYTPPSVALFGGTGGTGRSFLEQYLASAPTASINVLVRTPAKLADLQSQYPKQLQLIQSDIRNVDSVKLCLVQQGRMVDTVVSSIGMIFVRKGLSIAKPDSTICHEGTLAILKALEELEADPSILPPASGRRTKLVVLSTTGISNQGRDIPMAMIPLYHYLLKAPHEDKKKMEDVLDHTQRDWVAVRPSWLLDGEGKGMLGVRWSVEGSGPRRSEDDVAIGYAIARSDVARWILQSCILSGDQGFQRWSRKKVTITY
jgi:hypothetical protein